MLNNQLLLQGATGYNLSKSLRFRSSASAYLSRTPASAGNQQKWTWSGWAKLGAIQSGSLFGGDALSSRWTEIVVNSSGNINIHSTNVSMVADLITTQVFRDPSSWYHVLLSVDTTQATASNRITLHINGQQVTSFSTATYPAQNTSLAGVNQTVLHTVGKGIVKAGNFDGYLADTYFIDGQALTPSSFGSTNSQTGVWQPKKYAGTYGTNGFYLPFTDVATTSGSNAGLGKDFSGNGNYWNTNNISVTAGATYDSMKDVPTLTDADTANYAVLNPLFMAGTNGSLSNGNLTNTGGANPARAFTSTISTKAGGKFYAEFQATGGGNYCMFAVSDINLFAYTSGAIKGNGNISYDTNSLGANYYINSTSTTSSAVTITTNDYVMVAFDSTTRNVWFGKNGVWNESGNPSTGASPTGVVAGDSDLVFAVRAESTTINANFGQRPFAYTPPTGFKALNTYNLTTPTIGATASTLASKNFDVTTYTGNGSTQTITNSGSMQPDLVWVKSRSNAYNNVINDSIRGSTKLLITNGTDAEQTEAQSITSFNSNGFSLGTAGTWNQNGSTFVAWQWKANGSAVTNTAGSITSQVSANASAGFSIVTYTGNGTVGATIGHGLGVTPAMIIVKSRNSVQDWPVWHKGIANSNTLYLNLTVASSTYVNRFDPTGFTSSVFKTGSNGGSGSELNSSGNTHVAYCFSEVAGYSKFGSYTGNGSADGTFVHLGFRPKFVMIKQTSGAGQGWLIQDTARDTFNATGLDLAANSSGAEANDAPVMDIVSNGFKMRNTYGGFNSSSATYIYMAFAENPFKYSLAR